MNTQVQFVIETATEYKRFVYPDLIRLLTEQIGMPNRHHHITMDLDSILCCIVVVSDIPPYFKQKAFIRRAFRISNDKIRKRPLTGIAKRIFPMHPRGFEKHSIHSIVIQCIMSAVPSAL